MNAAIGAAGQRLAQDLRDARGTSGQHDDFPTVPFFEPERFFERVRVRLVELPARVVIANPRAGLVHPNMPLTRDDLLDADGDLHGVGPWRWANQTQADSYLFSSSVPLVPPNPNEFDIAYVML